MIFFVEDDADIVLNHSLLSTATEKQPLLFVPPVAAVNRGWLKSYCFTSLYQRSETSFPADTTERDFNSKDALISPVFCLLIRMTAVEKD